MKIPGGTLTGGAPEGGGGRPTESYEYNVSFRS